MDFEKLVKDEFEKLNLPNKAHIYIHDTGSAYLVEVSLGDKIELEQQGSMVFSYDYKNNKFYLSWIGLRKYVRGKGYAKLLMNALEKVTLLKRINRIETNTPVKNEDFLRKQGFSADNGVGSGKWIKTIYNDI